MSWVPVSDKVVHGCLYGVLGMTLAWGWYRAPGSLPHAVLIVIGAVYGLTDEWHQLFVPGRVADAGDWFADVVGLVTGYGTSTWLLGRQGDAADVDTDGKT